MTVSYFIVFIGIFLGKITLQKYAFNTAFQVMASETQKRWAEKIKNVHLRLRTRTQEVGAEAAWKEHLEEIEVLTDYSIAMKALAVDHWAKVNISTDEVRCRIHWIVDTVREYFLNGGISSELNKEKNRLKLSTDPYLDHAAENTDKFKLLDVGSCYNPFKNHSIFQTYAIDLCPADDEVRQCDFLEVNVSVGIAETNWFTSPVVAIPSDFFDIVVFCLFLEYLPCPEYRLKACKLAWDSLRCNGVLLIVTPDSNHQSARSKLMKEWNLALVRIGFVRFKLEKLRYLYCMAFRKTFYASQYMCLGRYKCDMEPKITTPQDFVNYRQVNY